jgi:hypothetical protein
MATDSRNDADGAATDRPQKPSDFRRSQRVLLRVPVRVSAEGTGQPSLAEDTTTLVVNAHGALMSMAANVSMCQSLAVTNLLTDEKLACRVATIGAAKCGKADVGLGFTQPAPLF